MEALEQCSNPELMAIIQRLDRRLADLEAQIANLQAQNAKLRKNSSTSSKPPSSDVLKPPKSKLKGRKKKRKIGGQPGHPKHERESFAEQDVDHFWEYSLDCCPDCGARVRRAKAKPRGVQQAEGVESPVCIDEHLGLASYCPRCDKVHYAPLPP